MITAQTDAPAGLALGRRWLSCYNEFLFLLMALRQVKQQQMGRGQLQQQICKRADQLTDLADQLQCLGFRPHARFCSEESCLWQETRAVAASMQWQAPSQDFPLELVLQDVERMRDAWRRFEQFVCSLGDEFFARLPALDPQTQRTDRLLQMMGQRGKTLAPAATNGVGPNYIR